jgi:hypothetical protein
MRSRLGLLLSVLTGFLAFSCASAPPITENKVTIELLSKKQVTDKFGVDQKLDPFIAPTGILRGKPNDFVVFKLSADLMNAAFTQLTITVKDKDGKASVGLFSKEEFKEFWRGWDAGEAKTANREALIEDFYVPGESFTIPKGRNVYYIVLIGGNPLNRPIAIGIDANVRGLPPYYREFRVE